MNASVNVIESATVPARCTSGHVAAFVLYVSGTLTRYLCECINHSVTKEATTCLPVLSDAWSLGKNEKESAT